MAMVRLSLLANPASVAVKRTDDVDDLLWLRVWAEWCSEGPNPNREVFVPLPLFLRNLGWFARACQVAGVSVEVDAGVRQALLSKRAAEQQLAEARRSRPLSEADVIAKLSGARFVRQLRPFQLRDLGKLMALPHGANFSVPGAGKTTVTYALYEVNRLAGRVRRLLVVAPLSAFDAWFSEGERWFTPALSLSRWPIDSGQQAEVCVVNYQRLLNSYEEISSWVSSVPTMVVLDEAHRMKRGWSGQWGSVCLSLALLAERRDVLSGTPAPQSPADLEAIFDFLWPGQARAVLPEDAIRPSPPADIGERVAVAIRPLFTRTTKSELQLPRVTFQSVVIPLAGLQKEIYDALRSRLLTAFDLTQLERVDLSRMGQVVMYLLEAATNPCLLPVGGDEFDIFRHPPLPIPPQSRLFDLIANYSRYETPRKFIELAKIVRDNADAGRKTLVWSNFVRNLQLLERQLARYAPAMIHGGVPSSSVRQAGVRTRESELQRFRECEDCMVLLANPAAMSEGVSLHEVCHHAVYMDRTFNTGQYLQSLDRIHRLGLAHDQVTEVSILATADTVDMVVDGRIRIKAERLGEMLEDAAISTLALPDDEDYGPAIDTSEDIAALFAHIRGDSVVRP